jgi:16S rRNA (guanine(966)-N(2))-methyltransferase RsmD
LRVIAGRRKGVALRCGRGPVLRPTAQVVKGSVFDTLGSDIDGTVFLDLFAGSGSVGIEALSRGAAKAVFVEQDHRILKALRTNLERCGFGRGEAHVRVGDALRFLERTTSREEFFDFIFADPPYSCDLAQRVVRLVEEAPGRICRMLVVEHGRTLFHSEQGVLEKIRTKKFGQTFVTYFRCGE